MFRTSGEIKDEVLIRLGVSTTAAGFYTDAQLNDWVEHGHRIAAAFRRWPFTEGRSNTTYVSSTEEYTYPEGWRSDSIRLLQLGGKRLRKLNFEDYNFFKEEFPSSTERVFSDFSNLYFINPSIDLSGTIAVFGQYTPVVDPTGSPTSADSLTVFTDREEEGNDAIIELMLSFARIREGNYQDSELHRQRAFQTLELIWKRIQDEQFAYHTHKDKEMWKRLDIVKGAMREDLLKRDQWF